MFELRLCRWTSARSSLLLTTFFHRNRTKSKKTHKYHYKIGLKWILNRDNNFLPLLDMMAEKRERACAVRHLYSKVPYDNWLTQALLHNIIKEGRHYLIFTFSKKLFCMLLRLHYRWALKSLTLHIFSIYFMF